ncbi:MAG: hypothetical protein M1118_11750, partial [Chloroflexi bacterium]|nr:hypothetical protein [Chloroflexota bacterium]
MRDPKLMRRMDEPSPPPEKTPEQAAISSEMKRAVGARRRGATFDRVLLRQAVGDAFHKLNPQQMVHNPVMFVVEVGSTITTIQFVREFLSKALSHLLFTGQITLWLWFTVLFANFAEAVAEARGKAQADSLRRTRQ